MKSAWKKHQQAYAVNNFGEKNRDGIIRQPVSTFTNLFITFFGIILLLIFTDDLGDKSSFSDWYWFFAIVYISTTFLMSIASFIYHARLTFWSEVGDNLTMYMWVTTILFSQTACLFHDIGTLLIIGFILINLIDI